MAARREAIERDAGGAEQLSQLKHDLVDRYLRTVVLIESVDAYLFEQQSLVNRRKKALFPVVRERAVAAPRFRLLLSLPWHGSRGSSAARTGASAVTGVAGDLGRLSSR